ncbi:MAG: TonB-dependent receptor [bacterium]|nr:TonB-dependent receptor [bacterium]
MKQKALYFVLAAALLSGLFFPASLAADIVEKVEVKGEIFSAELLNSKNMVIISEDDLQKLKIKDMADLFSFFTALNVSKRGASETSFDITMRGGNFEQVLVLVNGVPLNNAQTGHFNSDFPFSVTDVHRVEILRGGSSTTYGGGAFAGMVNIILKKESAFSVSLTGGENKFSSASLTAGKKFKNLSLRLSFNKDHSSGFHEGREFDNLKFTVGGYYNAANTLVDFFAGYLNKDFGAKGFYAPYSSTEVIDSYFYRFMVKRKWRNLDCALTYSFNRHNDFFVLDRERPALYSNESLTNQHYLHFTTAFSVKKLKGNGGFEVNRETMDSTSMGDRERDKGAVFLNLNYYFDKSQRMGVDLGIRRNFLPARVSRESNSNFTYYAGLYRRLGASFILKTGYGKSSRLPSFTELYYLSPSNIGDENLEPEVSHNFETSLSYLKENYQLDLSVFYRNQDNVIDWIKATSSSPWAAVNIEKNDILGIELTQRLHYNRTLVVLGIERLFAVNEHEGFQSKYGLRFPDFSLKLNLMQPIGKKLKAAINYHYKQIYNTEEKGHFMNLALSYPLGDLEFRLRMDNVFNTIIREIPGVEVPGRWIYFTVAYSR